MIFITPNTMSSPDEMIKSSAAVVTASSATVSMMAPRQNRVRPSPSASRQLRSGFRWALRARVDAREGLDHLDTAIGLHLAEVHRERRVALLVHLNLATRPVDGHLLQRLQ